MKALKIIVIILGILILLGIVSIAMAPSSVDMTRSVTINAPKEVVWSNMSSLQKMDAWTPWQEMDPDSKGGYEGPEGEVGSKGWWKGDVIGEGTQTITEIIEFEALNVDLNFVENGESTPAEGSLKMTETDDGSVNVDWGFHMEFSFWDKAETMLAMMTGKISMEDFEKEEELNKQAFDKGLANLKELCEGKEDEAETKTYEILTVEREAIRYIGMRNTISQDDVGATFQKLMPQIGMKAGAMMTGPPAGLFWTWDEENKTTDMAVVATVAEGDVDGMDAFEVEAGKALQVAYYGWYGDSYDAHMAINTYMKENELEMRDLVIEEYITDPGQEPDTAKWLTNIYYMVK